MMISACLVGLAIVLDDQAGPAGDDVQRGAQLVGDAGRQPPGGRQALGVAKLVERREPLLRRRAHLGRGGLEAIEHAVELAGQLAQLVALVRNGARAQIAGRDPPRLRDQLGDRAADDPGARPATSPAPSSR